MPPVKPIERFRFLVGICLILILPPALFNAAAAQQPWNFPTLDDACLSDAYLVTPPADLRLEVEQSLSAIPPYNTSYHLSGPYILRGKEFIRFQQLPSSADDVHAHLADFRLPVALASRLLPYLVSHTYWQQRYNSLSRWAFIDIRKTSGFLQLDTTDRPAGRYANLVWLGYRFQPSEDDPVSFSVSLDAGAPQQLTLRALERLAEWGAFISFADWLAYQRNHEAELDRQSRSQRILQRQIDSLSSIVSHFDRQADSMTVALQADSVESVRLQNLAEVERTKAHMDRNAIFLISVLPARANHMFGLELNFYNCFSKTISKIEVEVTPYNDRSRVQQDRFGRAVRIVRCMGPILPHAPARYTFDELFWDGGHIKYMRVTSVVFHFTDGSRRTFGGYDQILKHSLRQ